MAGAYGRVSQPLTLLLPPVIPCGCVDGQIIFLEDAEEILGKSWGVHVKLDPVWIERNEVRAGPMLASLRHPTFCALLPPCG